MLHSPSSKGLYIPPAPAIIKRPPLILPGSERSRRKSAMPLLYTSTFPSNSFEPAAGGGGDPNAISNTAYFWYQFDITLNNGDSYISCQELYFYDGDPAGSPTGVDFLNTSASNGSPSASTEFFGTATGGFTAPAYTNSTSLSWNSNAIVSSQWLKWSGTVANEFDVVSAAITSRGGEPARSPKDFTIEYSDDDSMWTAAKTVTGSSGWADPETRYFTWASVGGHRYWRINVTAVDGDAGPYAGIGILRLGCSNGEVITYTSTKAWAEASSIFSGGFPAIYAVDGTTNYWVSGASTATLTVLLGAARTLYAVGWKTENSGVGVARSPKDFSIKGSNDGSSYDTLVTFSGITDWVQDAERYIYKSEGS